MKTVLLLRHAKSSWEDSSLDDYERPLDPRGIRAAGKVGRHMATEGLIPDRVLCSGARRARETWEMVSAFLDARIPVEVLPAIYHGSADTVKALIQRLPDSDQNVLLVGHNPTFHHLASTLVAAGPEDAMAELRSKYPTGALAVLDFEVPSWNRVKLGTGHLRAFIRPRTL